MSFVDAASPSNTEYLKPLVNKEGGAKALRKCQSRKALRNCLGLNRNQF